MRTVMLLQTDGLTEVQRAVRDRFQEGGSSVAALLVMLVLAAVVLVAYLVTLRQRQTHALTTRPDPRKLFNGLLSKLNLTPPQRRLLNTVANARGLKHPAVILICPALFDRHVAKSQTRPRHDRSKGSNAPPPDVVAETRAVLFP
jgi:hypothetical protein